MVSMQINLKTKTASNSENLFKMFKIGMVGSWLGVRVSEMVINDVKKQKNNNNYLTQKQCNKQEIIYTWDSH